MPKYFLSSVQYRPSLLAGAARHGHLAFMKALDPIPSTSYVDSGGAAVQAALGGHLHVYEWLQQRFNIIPSTDVATGAAYGGHISFLEYLESHGLSQVHLLPNIAERAARGGQWRVLEWLAARGTALLTLQVLVNALESGSLATVQWIMTRAPRLIEDSQFIIDFLGSAVKSLELVQYLLPLLDKKPPHDKGLAAVFKAAQNGNLEVLRFLIGHGCVFLGETDFLTPMIAALRERNKPMVRYLLDEAGYKFTTYDFTGALGARNFGFLSYVKALGCPITQRAYMELIYQSDLRVPRYLRWLRDNGAPWNYEAYQVAATYGCVELVQALRDEGCPIDARVHLYMPQSKNYECGKLLRALVPLDETLFTSDQMLQAQRELAVPPKDSPPIFHPLVPW